MITFTAEKASSKSVRVYTSYRKPVTAAIYHMDTEKKNGNQGSKDENERVQAEIRNSWRKQADRNMNKWKEKKCGYDV